MGSPCLTSPVGNRGAPLARLPCMWLPGFFFQKKHHNRRECLSKKSTARETTSSPAFSPEEKLTHSTCQGMSISLSHCSQMDQRQPTMLNQGKEVSRQSWLLCREDLLPQLGNVDGVICRAQAPSGFLFINMYQILNATGFFILFYT